MPTRTIFVFESKAIVRRIRADRIFRDNDHFAISSDNKIRGSSG